MLRLRLGPAAALEVADEGPEVGGRTELIERFALDSPQRVRARRLLLRGLSRLPRRSSPPSTRCGGSRRWRSRSSTRATTPTLWEALAIPGAPYALALERDGTVGAKGTFNNLSQLESILATAERRRAERARIEASVSEPDRGDGGRLSRALEGIASSSSRRGFLARVGKGMAAVTAGGVVAKLVEPGEADGYHFCGHIFTTDSCPHPLGRLDAADRPRRLPARSARAASRSTTSAAASTTRASRWTADGNALQDPDGRPLPPAPRTKVCEEATQRDPRHPHPGRRRLVPLLRRPGPQARRLLLDLEQADQRRRRRSQGYCYRSRKVFCVMYFDTNVPC